MAARALRGAAADLARDGHLERALAALADANAQCVSERASSADLELSALADIGKCSAARAFAAQIPAGRDATSASRAMATCDGIEAPEKGTDKTMRAKMREARVAELAKDFPRAQGLYLDAWAEQHTPRALEAAARVAALAGDLPTSRRLLGRTLALAEAGASQVAHLTSIPQVTRGSPYLAGDELTLAAGGTVIRHDLKSGNARVLVDAVDDYNARLSTAGTFAVARHKNTASADVFDLLTGTLAFKVDDVGASAFSPDDTLFAVSFLGPSPATEGRIRVFDTITGEVVASLKFEPIVDLPFVGFAPDRNHVIAVGGRDVAAATPATIMREWDLSTKAPVGPDLVMGEGIAGAAATSRDGHWLVYRRLTSSGTTFVRVRDMVTGKPAAELPGRFFSVDGYAISEDGKTIATGSSSSIRLWDVAKNKQLYVVKDERSYDDQHLYTFSDDGTALIKEAQTMESWDVATGKMTAIPLSTRPTIVDASWSPDGSVAAIATPYSVNVVGTGTKEPLVVCDTEKDKMQRPMAIAFSHDGKSFACATDNGPVRIYDATTWTERAKAKGAAFTTDIPVDLGFAQDDKAISVIVGKELRRFDAQTGADIAKVTLKHPTKTLASRHTLFGDGTLAVWLAGGAALFDAAGVYQRDVALPTPTLASVFSRDGKTYVSMTATGIDILDVTTGTTRNVPYVAKVKSSRLVVSSDGKAIAVVSSDGGVTTITGEEVRTLDHVTASRVWFAGRGLAMLVGSNAIALRRGAEPLATLELQSSGLLASLSTGMFETRGKPEIICVVGTTTLERGTCAEREREDVVGAWLDRAKP